MAIFFYCRPNASHAINLFQDLNETIMDNPFKELDRKLDSLSDKVEGLRSQIIDQMPRKDILTLEGVEKYTGLKQTTLLKHKRSGELKSYKKGGRLYFYLSDVIDWLTNNTSERQTIEDHKNSKHELKEKRHKEAHENMQKIKVL